MTVIGLRTKNKDICKERVHEHFRRFSMINTGAYVPAVVTMLWDWIHDDLRHPKSVRGQGNLNLVALPRIPEELDDEAELVLDYDRLKENAKSINSNLLNRRIEDDEESPEGLFDGVLIDSREVPEERTRSRDSVEKAEPEFDLQEGDLCSYSHFGVGSTTVFPVVVTRRTSRNVWVDPVEFKAPDFKTHPNEKKSLGTYGQAYSISADEDEIGIARDENGNPVRQNGWMVDDDFPKRFYINKAGEWEEYGEQRSPAYLRNSIQAKDASYPR